MILLDTNILVYAQKHGAVYESLREQLQGKSFCVSLVTKLESLGYHLIGDAEHAMLTAVLKATPVLAITEEIINYAIILRRQRSTTVADAIIAATAKIHSFDLWTHNTKDFKHFNEISLFDPIPGDSI